MSLRFAPLFLLFMLAVPAQAQSGRGLLSGIVLPEDPNHDGQPERWPSEGQGGDTHVGGSPYVKLIPIEAHTDPAPILVRARGIYGRYDFGLIPMGLYRLRIEAPGYEPWEAEVYVPSDSRSEIHVLLHTRK